MLDIQSKNEISLFHQISKRLTFFNLRILIIFIILFNISVGIVLSFYIYLDQKSDLITVLKQEIKEVKMNASSTGPDYDNAQRKHKRKINQKSAIERRGKPTLEASQVPRLVRPPRAYKADSHR